MNIISYAVTQDGEHIGKSPIREQAVNAAKMRAESTGKPVTVTATLDDGRTKEVIYHPDGFIQKIWEIAQSTPFSPEVGKTYRNAGGGTFRCDQADGTEAWMTNVKSGWHFKAHGCRAYFDGSIEWDYSTAGEFVNFVEI